MILFLLFSIIICQNIIKNPSFKEVENDKVLNWNLGEGVELITSDLGKNAIHWKNSSQPFSCYQGITLEKGFQYEIKTAGAREYFYSRSYYEDLDWKTTCHLTGIIKNPNNKSYNYYFDLYSVPQKDLVGEIFVDEVRRINFRIGINNDRDEVYDNVNVVYQINGHKDNYNLTDFE